MKTNELRLFMVSYKYGNMVWENQFNQTTKRHLYLEDLNIENQVPDKFKKFTKIVWDDIHNNDTLIYDNFDDYYNDKFNEIKNGL